MEREILFRSAHYFTSNGLFSHFSYWGINYPEKGINTYPSQNNKTEIRCHEQFTGLTDKVNCKYFDGCIGNYFNCKFVVVWDNGWYAEFIETKKKRNLADLCDDSVHIGNIHDNPELLK